MSQRLKEIQSIFFVITKLRLSLNATFFCIHSKKITFFFFQWKRFKMFFSLGNGLQRTMNCRFRRVENRSKWCLCFPDAVLAGGVVVHCKKVPRNTANYRCKMTFTVFHYSSPLFHVISRYICRYFVSVYVSTSYSTKINIQYNKDTAAMVASSRLPESLPSKKYIISLQFKLI